MRLKIRSALLALTAVCVLSGLTAASALASGKPFAETTTATSISETSATLHGVVNPEGAETKYSFEYGPTTSYGFRTAEVSAGSGTANLEASATIENLIGDKEYHFRIVATNSSGTTDGADSVFTTGGKPFAETKPPTDVLGKRATLHGIVNPRGYATKYYFEYGTTLSYGSKTAEVSAGSGTSNVEARAEIEGLESGVNYHFRVVATNSRGTTDGADIMFPAAGLPEFATRGTTKFPVTFIGSSGGEVHFHESNGGDLWCKSSTITGEIINSKEVANVRMAFFTPGTCATETYMCAPTNGKWESSPLKGRIAYLNKAKEARNSTVGLLLEPVKQPFALCKEESNEITGSIIGEIGPINEEVTEYQLKYKSSQYGTQEPQHFEGEELIHNLAMLAPKYKLGLEAGYGLTTPKIEIRA